MPSPTVSVVIPTFNRAVLLPDAIRSALGQTYRPLEVIVVDDGSTEDIRPVCASFPTVRYLRQDNAGVSAARNHGVRMASGAYVAFLDSDDEWEPDKLEVQVCALGSWPVAWSVTNATIVSHEGQPLPSPQGFARGFPQSRELATDPDGFLAAWLRRGSIRVGEADHVVFHGDLYAPLFLGNFCWPSSLVVDRQLCDRIGGFDPTFRLAEETEFCHRLSAAAQGALVMTPLLRWRRTAGPSLISSQNIATLAANALQSLEQAARLRPDVSPTVAKLAATGRRRLLLHLAYAKLSDYDRRGARGAAVSALRSGWPLSLGALGIMIASCMPSRALRTLHSIKRASRGSSD